MKTTDQLGSLIMTQGGGDLAAFRNTIKAHIEETAEDFIEAVEESFAHLANNADETADAAKKAETIFIRLDTYRVAAETVSKLIAETSVSRLDVPGLARVAGAAYRDMVSDSVHSRIRDALEKLGYVDRTGRTAYEATINPTGWSIDL